MGLPRHGAIKSTKATTMTDTPKVRFESRMLIDGKLVDGEAGTFTNINPATEEVLGEVADASKADMHRAIDAARRAFDETDWSTEPRVPQALPRAAAGGARGRAGGAARGAHPRGRLPAHGHPRPAARRPARRRADVPGQAHRRVPVGDRPRRRDGRRSPGVNTTRKVWHEPVGVVGAIVPWNFPFEVTINKLGQALATGNTVVLKPAPDTPFNATRLGRLIAEQTDIPPGVVNVVTASDHFVGEELTLSPKVDLISFTGSTAVGKRIMEKGAATMKRLFLELGGKSATIVLEDADFDAALPDRHRRRACTPARAAPTPTRMLLPRSRYDEGVAILKGIYENVAAGRPAGSRHALRPGHLGQAARAASVGYIQKGVDEGATLLVGGTEPPEGARQGILRQAQRFSSTSTTR